jgi:hypothetical protein
MAPAQAENYSLTLSNPDQPANIEVAVLNGSITVEGYEGKTIEITTNLESLESLRNEQEKQDSIEVNIETEMEGDNRKKRSTAGLKKVANNAVQVDIEERNNKVEIASHTRNKHVNLTLKVPFNAKLNLSLHKGGDIRVSDVNGAMELGNARGAIYAENVTGPIVAESHRKDIEVSFKSLEQSAPSSLTSHRGSIDVSLPSTVKAKVEVHTYKGEIYSGLDVDFEADNQVDHKKKGSGQEIKIGGLMTTYRGDIYIRKK